MIGFTRTTASGAGGVIGSAAHRAGSTSAIGGSMDWQQEIEKFPMIRKAAEEALEAFKESGIEDLYTPGDLRVVDVAWCFHEDGDHEWLITIEEAAPEADTLRLFITGKLAEKQIAAKVITEW